MANPALPLLDLKNIQGDILVGFPKKTETYFFFQIDKARVGDFRKQLSRLVPRITSVTQAGDDRQTIRQNKPAKSKVNGINIVFSVKGLRVLGIKDNTGDAAFEDGMLKGAESLGDQGTVKPDKSFDPDWLPAFKQDIHGLILMAGDSHHTVHEALDKIKDIFYVGQRDASVHEVLRLVGDVRPGKESGHEHFGFLDGVSQPAVAGIDANPNPGQETVRQGIILLGREGDQNAANRPAWAIDGSFLAFRYLPQLVPEFDQFLKANPIPEVLPPSRGSELLGARLVGRWKSGAPIDIAFAEDDEELGRDKLRNNDFRYDFPGDQQNQDRCPFAAHARKTNPRADLDQFGGTELRRILRRGIQFGPELTDEEKRSGKTKKERGLLFACYQSNIPNGFQFIQQSWANKVDFPPEKPPAGFDPIIGQAGPGKPRSLIGTNPKSQNTSLNLTQEWVLGKGGEYFFSPSISTLKNKFALAEGKTEL